MHDEEPTPDELEQRRNADPEDDPAPESGGPGRDAPAANPDRLTVADDGDIAEQARPVGESSETTDEEDDRRQ